jgi:hypothetical protein
MQCSIGKPIVPTHIYYIENGNTFYTDLVNHHKKNSHYEENTWITDAQLIDFNTILINNKYKIIYDNGFASDLIASGIKPGGKINARLKWASNKGFLYLLTENSEFLNKIQKCEVLYKKPPIKKPKIGSLYLTKTHNKFLYLGKAYTVKTSYSKSYSTQAGFKEIKESRKQRCNVWLNCNQVDFKAINKALETFPNSKIEYKDIVSYININDIRPVEEVNAVNITKQDIEKLYSNIKRAFGFYYVDVSKQYTTMTSGYKDYFNPDKNYAYISGIVNLDLNEYKEVELDKLKMFL